MSAETLARADVVVLTTNHKAFDVDFIQEHAPLIRVKNACNDNGNEVNFHFTDSFWITILSNKNDTGNDTGNDTDRGQKIISLIKNDAKITINKLAANLNVSKSTILREMKELKENKKIKRIGKEKGGHWKITE